MPRQDVKKIMVIEDDESDHNMLCDFLAAKGFEVISVRDARAVFDRISITKPDLIMVALMLNDFISGDEIVEKLKSDGEFNTPVVGMSSQVNADSDYFYNLCDYRIAKPLTIANISKIITEVFEEMV